MEKGGKEDYFQEVWSCGIADELIVGAMTTSDPNMHKIYEQDTIGVCVCVFQVLSPRLFVRTFIDLMHSFGHAPQAFGQKTVLTILMIMFVLQLSN